jgi:predicted O-methyltransferase YrrM
LAQPPGKAPPEFQGGREGPFGPMRAPVMIALDGDGDGELSADEIADAAKGLKKLDKDGDGKLSREELRPQFAGRGGQGGPGFGPPDGRGGREFGPPEGRGAPGFGPPGGPGPGEGGRQSSFQTETRGKDDGEGKILETLRRIQQEQGRRMNVPDADGRLLRLLAESIEAKKVVEFGTSNGISAIWMSLALRKTDGRLFTHEIDPDTAALARKNFEAAGVVDIVAVVEGDGHEKAADLKGPIDLVFIDADKEGYLDYYQKTLPLVRPGGLICAHNMNPRMASADFVKAITTDPNVETVFYLDGGGMSVTLKKR